MVMVRNTSWKLNMNKAKMKGDDAPIRPLKIPRRLKNQKVTLPKLKFLDEENGKGT